MSLETSTSSRAPREPGGPPTSCVDAPSSARERLAAQQFELVDALTARTGAPDSFDPVRVHLTRRMLARKRCHGVEKSWPALIAAMGDRWIETFAGYVMNHPIPAGGGAFEDGLAFARHLRRARKLPAKALPILLVAEARRGRPIRVGLTSRPRRLVVAVRVAGRPRVLIVPPVDFSRPFGAAPR